MAENMVKVTIPLPADNLAGAASESVWTQPQGDGIYRIKNVPFYAKGISFDDLVKAEEQEDVLMFKGVVRPSGHSTYRIFASGGRTAPEVMALVETLKE